MNAILDAIVFAHPIMKRVEAFLDSDKTELARHQIVFFAFLLAILFAWRGLEFVVNRWPKVVRAVLTLFLSVVFVCAAWVALFFSYYKR